MPIFFYLFIFKAIFTFYNFAYFSIKYHKLLYFSWHIYTQITPRNNNNKLIKKGQSHPLQGVKGLEISKRDFIMR